MTSTPWQRFARARPVRAASILVCRDRGKRVANAPDALLVGVPEELAAAGVVRPTRPLGECPAARLRLFVLRSQIPLGLPLRGGLLASRPSVSGEGGGPNRRAYGDDASQKKECATPG